jgi:hypothetical protein
MQAQMCKICGERHHRYEPHRFPNVDPSYARQSPSAFVRRLPTLEELAAPEAGGSYRLATRIQGE